MASGKVADCGRIRKERSQNGRIWGEGRRVRRKMNGVGGETDCGRIYKERSKMGGYRVKGEG